MNKQTYWRKCAVCKTEIGYNQVYVKCSVSTCRKNIYCSDRCWDVHVPVLNHKSAWAEDERSPMSEQTKAETKPQRRIVVSSKNNSSKKSENTDFPIDVLIVASKLKTYVKERHQMNTSANVLNKLSDIVRAHVDEAISQARSEGRKTLMDRDFK